MGEKKFDIEALKKALEEYEKTMDLNSVMQDSEFLGFQESIEKLTLTVRSIANMIEVIGMKGGDEKLRPKLPYLWYINEYLLPLFDKIVRKQIDLETKIYKTNEIMNKKLNTLFEIFDKFVGK